MYDIYADYRLIGAYAAHEAEHADDPIVQTYTGVVTSLLDEK